MRGDHADVLEHLRGRLADARDEAAAVYDRAAALEELFALAIRVAGELEQRTLTIGQLQASALTADERARLDSLTRRAFPEPTEDERNGHAAVPA